MEKNIVEIVSNIKGEVLEKVADYIGVISFSTVVENLYRECLENFDDKEEFEEYFNDLFGEKYIHNEAFRFALYANKEMKKYLHKDSQHMDGNFANLYEDYPKHVTGVRWASDYDGDDYYDFYPQMVARLDSAQRTASRLARTERTSKNGISKHSVRTTSSTISPTSLKRFTL
jgi:hypothetical protein